MQTRRRRFLAAAGGCALLAACTPQRLLREEPPLARPKISADRVTRVLVGLRPYRASGFVVRADSLGGKKIVHNYGHGGGGITLSWGSSELAVDLGFDSAVRQYAVLGCGVMGLSTATLLQRRGGAVTIYTKDLPPDTTSNIAGGHWNPTSVFDPNVASEAFVDQFHRAVRIAYRSFQTMVGPRYGVSWRRSYVVHDHFVPIGPRLESLRDVMPELATLEPGEHPFGDNYVVRYDAMMIEPAIHLRALMDDFLLAGGKIVVRDFASAGEVASLPEPVAFNCTGLGARELFGDPELEPVRGQLVVCLPQREMDYNLMTSPSYYIFPRTDGLILGGTFEHGNPSTEPDPDTTARIIEGNAKAAALLA